MRSFLNGVPRHGLRFVLAVGVALAVSLAPTAARAQNQYFDTDLQTIGVVNGGAFVGTVNTSPFTVFANAGTNVTLGMEVRNNATLDMSGGTINGMTLFDSAILNKTGGTIGGAFLSTTGNSVANLSGGNVDFAAAEGGVINLSGGTVGTLYSDGSGVVNVTGGYFGFAQVTGTLCLFGQNLTANTIFSTPGVDALYELSGSLLDGTDVTGSGVYVLTFANPTFKIINASDVPEPGVVAFGVIAAGSVLGLVARKRKK